MAVDREDQGAHEESYQKAHIGGEVRDRGDSISLAVLVHTLLIRDMRRSRLRTIQIIMNSEHSAARASYGNHGTEIQ